jgi:hypothetical protein
MPNWISEHPSPSLIMFVILKDYLIGYVSEGLVSCSSIKEIQPEVLEQLELVDASNYFKY